MHLRTTQECSFATVYHSPYATVAYPDMQRWHKANDTPSQGELSQVQQHRLGSEADDGDGGDVGETVARMATVTMKVAA